jgi:hypothetical protein
VAPGQFSDFINKDLLDPLNNQLGNAVTPFNCNGLKGVVIYQDNPDFASVASINYPGRINHPEPGAQS